MGNKQKNKSQKLKPTLRNDIIRLFQDNPKKQFNYKQIASFLEVSDNEIRKLVYKILLELSEEKILEETQRGKFRKGRITKRIEGTIQLNRKGHGYVVSESLEEDLFIDRKNIHRVIHGDRVVVEFRNRGKKRAEGVVTEVIGQQERTFVGRLEISEKFAFLVPNDPRIDLDIFIPLGKIGKVDNGSIVVGRIVDWPETAKSPFGEIIEVLGTSESHDVEMKSILISNGIRYEFPEEVLNEANRINISLDEEEVKKRRDFRDILTMTIDPVDAKDFDDALSIEYLENGWTRVGVHIADVAHYIREGSALDKEALERGNSVYLVDRVVPMLPEHLSNGVCSLRPDEDKFAFSAVFDLNENAEIEEEWFGKTVIRSARRFAYEEAQERIETGKGDLSKEILTLDGLAKILRSRRMKDGALEIASSELRFELDEKGNPIRAYKKVGKDANQLIEEYMLLANRRVGQYVGDTNRKVSVPLIYRIHDRPDREKLEQFAVFLSKFGKQVSFRNERKITEEMNRIFREMKDETEFPMVQQMAIKSMAKAVYDTENIGHYGLGFRYYAHFTSPIRRYADLMVHRILFNELNKVQKHYKDLQETAEHISRTERRAVDAERSSQKYFQAVYLEHNVGEVFTGVITGLTDWGIYVEMHQNHCEGMVSLKTIQGDRYYFDEQNYVVVGSRSGQEFNLGDVIEVELVGVNIARRQIDLELVD